MEGRKLEAPKTFILSQALQSYSGIFSLFTFLILAPQWIHYKLSNFHGAGKDENTGSGEWGAGLKLLMSWEQRL